MTLADCSEREPAAIAGHYCVGDGVELQIWFYARIDCHLFGGSAAITAGGNAKDTVVGIRGESVTEKGQTLYLGQLFVIGKEKRLVFLDSPAQSATELMTAECRESWLSFGGVRVVKKVAGIQRA